MSAWSYNKRNSVLRAALDRVSRPPLGRCSFSWSSDMLLMMLTWRSHLDLWMPWMPWVHIDWL